MAKGEQPLRRARCKRPPEKVGKPPSGQVAKVAKVKKTALAKATAAGLVPRAMRPFALFCKQKGLKCQAASAAWKNLSGSERESFAEQSRMLFASQRAQGVQVGVVYKKDSRTNCDTVADGLARGAAKSAFALFCKNSKLRIAVAAAAWKEMTNEQKQPYKDMFREEQLAGGAKHLKNKDKDVVACNGNYPESLSASLGDEFELMGSAERKTILGKGTYSTVYLVRHIPSQRLLAAKVEQVSRTLKTEAAILDGLKHCAILPSGRRRICEGSLSWMTMPLMPWSLHGFVCSEGKLKWDLQVALMHQISSGLNYLEKRKTVHADVKPDNVLMDPHRQSFYLTDFGLSVRLPIDPGWKGPAYAARFRPPELWCRAPDLAIHLNHRCDSWAFGFTALTAAIGKDFFQGETDLEIYKEIQALGCDTMFKRMKQAIVCVAPKIRGQVIQLVKTEQQERADCDDYFGEEEEEEQNIESWRIHWDLLMWLDGLTV